MATVPGMAATNYLENTTKEDASLREKTGSSCLGEINVRIRIASSLGNATLGKQASSCPAPHCTGARMWYPEMGTDLKLWMWEPQGRSGSGAGMESSIFPPTMLSSLRTAQLAA